MKAIIIIAIVLTVAIIVLKYKKDKNIKKLLISMLTFGFIISLSVMGNLTKTIMPIFIAHEILVFIAWVALVWMYVFKNKYCWWWFISPLVTIGLFVLLEYLEGSRHGILA